MTVRHLAATLLAAAALAVPLRPALAEAAHAAAADSSADNADAAAPDPQALPMPPAAQWQPLARQGISLSLSYTGEAAGNPTGGLRHASALTNQFYMGADADLNTMLGWQGAAIHFAVTDRRGPSLSNTALGNNTS
ncbi:MAG TPA: carbohydrate porin, partial [Novosphingobium sp.]|nr:carbohydrate porin [Novosphingobium sp.]